jgi:ribosome-binding protein aMBF1 (putative translation factor)
MTMKIIQSASVSLPALGNRTDWSEQLPSTSGRIRTYDLRNDELPRTGSQDEFTIDEYLAEQGEAVNADVDAQGSWVADTLYPGKSTIATLRLRAGLSQKDLAAKCGLAQPHVSRYESGSTEPGALTAKTMANALGVTLDQFVEALQNTILKDPS